MNKSTIHGWWISTNGMSVDRAKSASQCAYGGTSSQFYGQLLTKRQYALLLHVQTRFELGVLAAFPTSPQLALVALGCSSHGVEGFSAACKAACNRPTHNDSVGETPLCQRWASYFGTLFRMNMPTICVCGAPYHVNQYKWSPGT